MRRRRFLLQWIGIAFAALVTPGYTLWCRSVEFAAKASIHMRNIKFLHTHETIFLHMPRETLTANELARIGREQPDQLRFLKVRFARWDRYRQYENEMYEKYARAARCPWLPVGLDPDSPYPR
jgi:hypothetical protein